MQSHYDKISFESKKDRIHCIKFKTKKVSNILSRQLQSPFRSTKIRSLNNTSYQPILQKQLKISPVRSKLSVPRGQKSEKQPIKAEMSISTTDSMKSRNNHEEDSINVIKTPTTIQEDEITNADLIEESLAKYFNPDTRYMNSTPMQNNKTPDIKYYHRYTNTMPLSDLNPFRSETPEIPTRSKPEKIETRFPKVEKKNRVFKGLQRKRSPSPDNRAKAKSRLDFYQKGKNPYFFIKK